jgi:L-ascorbate oxidase
MAAHPIHLHGHNVAVVNMGVSTSPLTTSTMAILKTRITPSLEAAPMKDTFLVPDRGYTTVRFVADNPGYWLLHCHLEIHTKLGMGLIVQVKKT